MSSSEGDSSCSEDLANSASRASPRPSGRVSTSSSKYSSSRSDCSGAGGVSGGGGSSFLGGGRILVRASIEGYGLFDSFSMVLHPHCTAERKKAKKRGSQDRDGLFVTMVNIRRGIPTKSPSGLCRKKRIRRAMQRRSDGITEIVISGCVMLERPILLSGKTDQATGGYLGDSRGDR